MMDVRARASHSTGRFRKNLLRYQEPKEKCAWFRNTSQLAWISHKRCRVNSALILILFRDRGLVAPASRRRFCAAMEIQKSPAGRWRHQTPNPQKSAEPSVHLLGSW